MDVGSALFTAAIMFIVAFYLALPILQGSGKQPTRAERQLSSLQARREQILNAIYELDLDRTMEKINPEDYQLQRSALTAEGTAILRDIDLLEQKLVSDLPARTLQQHIDPAGPPAEAGGSDNAPAQPRTEDLEAKLEQEIRAARARLSEPDQHFCPQCGSEILASDRFCSRCGASLAREESSG